MARFCSAFFEATTYQKYQKSLSFSLSACTLIYQVALTELRDRLMRKLRRKIDNLKRDKQRAEVKCPSHVTHTQMQHTTRTHAK
jgi:hypothetical protein